MTNKAFFTSEVCLTFGSMTTASTIAQAGNGEGPPSSSAASLIVNNSNNNNNNQENDNNDENDNTNNQHLLPQHMSFR